MVRRFLILLASLAVLLAACGGSTTEATDGDGSSSEQTAAGSSSTTSTSESPSDEPDPGEDGKWTLEDFIPGAQAFDEDTDFRAIEMEAQQAVAECMAAEGFDYIPFVPSDVGGGFGPEEFDEGEYVKKYGFGVATWVVQEEEMRGEDGEFEDPYANDPNMEIVDAMDEFEQEEYFRVLYGGEPPIIENTPPEELEAMTEEELMAFYDEAYANWMPDGCYNKAYDELYGGGEADMAFWEEFSQDFDDMDQRVQSDPRILEAQTAWSACMADKGHDFADQEEMYGYFYGRDVNGQWVEGEFQQRVNEVVTWPEDEFAEGEDLSASEEPATTLPEEVGEGEEGEFEYYGPVYDMEELQPLIDEEIAVATANYECELPIRNVWEEVWEEYQQLFIEENLDRLLAFREQND